MTTADVDREAGEYPARASAVCSHGASGYCHDDALPGERQAVEYLFGAAYAYAEPAGRDTAERFAAWVVARAWRPGVVSLGTNLSRDFERFSADL